MNFLIYIAAGIAAYLIFTQLKPEGVNMNLSNKDLLLRNMLKDIINDVRNEFNLIVLESEILAVIKQETGYLLLDKENSEIIGDRNLTNKAFGAMQIRRPAMIDVNNFFNTSFTEKDLQNSIFNNIAAGSCYLDMCKMTALNESSDNAEFMMFKKYNAGIGTTASKTAGNQYAENCLTYKDQFKYLA